MANRAQKRPNRIPLHQQNRFEFHEEEGFRYYMVPELPGEVDRHLAAGYEFVTDPNVAVSQDQESGKEGSIIRKIMNQRPDAAFKTGVLMRIPMEYFQEDRAARRADQDAKLASLNPANSQDPSVYGYMKITKGE